MNKIRVVQLLLTFICIATVGIPLTTQAAAIDSWIKGASITPTSPTQFSTESFAQSLTNLRQTNANYVSFVIPIYQSNINSSDIGPGGNTPTDESLIVAITKAHELGFTVALKPHLDPYSGEWRAYIDPSDRAAWFATYDALMVHYATLAEENDVEMIIVGTELIHLSSDSQSSLNTPGWRDLIQKVRAVYTGKLTYAANWGTGWADEKNKIAFWDDLDYVGVDAYYSLGDTSDNSVPTFMAAWEYWYTTDFKPFAESVQKPIFFTEVGYRSTIGAHLSPAEYTINGGYSDVEQANAYTALFSFWGDKPDLVGISIWDWKPDPAAGGVGDQDYSPQHKTAESILTAWYGGYGVPYVAPKLTSIATPNSINAVRGTQVQATADVQNAGGLLSSALVDVEVYAENGSKVYQNFVLNQSLSSATITYPIAWTPSANGTYTVKIGVFSNDWTTAYSWNNSAGTILVGDASTSTKPASFSGTVSTNGVISLNSPLTLIANIQNAGGAAQALIDMEVYASNGTRVFQEFFDNQSFGASESKTLSTSWTPTAVDTYKVALGMFSPHWVNVYTWIDTALQITLGSSLTAPSNISAKYEAQAVVLTWNPVPGAAGYRVYRDGTPIAVVTGVQQYTDATVIGDTTYSYTIRTRNESGNESPDSTSVLITTSQTPETPPTSSGVIETWWPVQSAAVSGTQPFKALLKGYSADDYGMMWQVDGGALNTMYTDANDYPHKEALVDVSSWNWKGDGPYILTFVAKDTNGSVIATQNIPVTVSR